MLYDNRIIHIDIMEVKREKDYVLAVSVMEGKRQMQKAFFSSKYISTDSITWGYWLWSRSPNQKGLVKARCF